MARGSSYGSTAESVQAWRCTAGVDEQNGFCPDGALPIEHGDEVVAERNLWVDTSQQQQVLQSFLSIRIRL